MAIEAERLLAIFEARFTSLEKALTKARTDAGQAFTAIEDAGKRAETALSKVGSRGMPGIQQTAIALRSTRVEVGNLAAQLNDIGVQLAGGQSPFLIAIQQGSQITQALGSGIGARGAVAALGGAFASLLNPVSLATIAIIGLGGTAIQYFASLLSDGKKSAEQLKQEADLVRRVAAEWGDAMPALKAYVDQKQRLADAADRDTATQAAINEQYQKARDQLSAISGSLQQVLADLALYGGQDAVIKQLQDAFADLNQKVTDNTATADDARAVQQLLANVLATTGIQSVDGMTDAVGRMIPVLKAANAETLKLAAAYQPIGGETIAKGKTSRSGRTLNDAETVNLATRTNPALFDDAGVETTKPTRDREAEEAQRQRDAVRELIADMEFERSLIGLTNVEREKAIALRRAEAGATDTELQYIGDLVEKTYQEKEAVKAAREEKERAARAANFLRDTMWQAFSSIIPAIETGNRALDQMLNTLIQVAAQALLLGTGPLAGLFGGGGGLLSAIFHGGGTAGSPGGQRRRVSAAVFAGAPRYHDGSLGVGEVPAILKRGEIVDPGDGSVFRKAFGAGMQEVLLRVIGMPGPEFIPIIEATSQGQAVRVVQSGLAAYDKNLNRTFGSRIANSRMRQL